MNNLTIWPCNRDKLLPCEHRIAVFDYSKGHGSHGCGSLAKFTVVVRDSKETEQNLCPTHALEAVFTAMQEVK